HKKYSMMEGIEERPELVAFVGYHAAAGTPGVLSHTFIGSGIYTTRLNGRLMSEGYLNSLLCAEYGGRLAVVSGDDLTCADAHDYAPAAECVAVKTAVDRYTARCLHPTTTFAMLHEAASTSVDTAAVPELPAAPYTCEVVFADTHWAAAATMVPGVERVDDHTVQFTFDTVGEVYRCFAASVRIAGGAREQSYG
ncbi:MAG: M55 family metallopeptidase, partial [Nocardioidaceae bacterium]